MSSPTLLPPPPSSLASLSLLPSWSTGLWVSTTLVTGACRNYANSVPGMGIPILKIESFVSTQPHGPILFITALFAPTLVTPILVHTVVPSQLPLCTIPTCFQLNWLSTHWVHVFVYSGNNFKFPTCLHTVLWHVQIRAQLSYILQPPEFWAVIHRLISHMSLPPCALI